MAAQKVIRLCSNVGVLAFTLAKLNERASGDKAQEMLLRMKLAALTTELIATDLIERARQRSTLT
jgi:hypothetical protein